jgi:hypothetical protein
MYRTEATLNAVCHTSDLNAQIDIVEQVTQLALSAHSSYSCTQRKHEIRLSNANSSSNGEGN